MNIADIAVMVNAGGGSPTPTPSAGFEPDLVLKLNTDDLSAASSAEVISGDFNAIEEKALAEEPIVAIVYGARHDNPGYPFTRTFTTIACYFNNYGYDPVEHQLEMWVADFRIPQANLLLRAIGFARDGFISFGQNIYYISLNH